MLITPFTVSCGGCHDYCVVACALLQMTELESKHSSQLAAVNAAKEDIEASVRNKHTLHFSDFTVDS